MFGSGPSATTRWALVPLKLNELTPASRSPLVGHLRNEVGTATGNASQSMSGLGILKCR